ncbi:hypothetical protein [Xanthomonas arboricola]|uniref:hypothetical protein n=1 Tax=Xanthomonas arboricola TaxID=56448 RepID=UPI00063EAAB7|nr:hypothetical protein [Xanthomonas arboricola]MBB3847758.1 hypothetical protein [Xanthomonas arboricola]CAD7381108.1 hypothetical protein X12_002127 [Xanthomonas arboricola]CAD7381205.1 hypothetical protein X12_002146 [Xanthomonas arboricola]CAG2090131.1 hypothetical protein XCY_002126 [Xanthomonas arboricola pv. juglandis]
MSKPNTLVFIGWDYASPASTVLKRALMDSEFPWRAMAIVHDVLLTDSVDSIPLMSTNDFLARDDLAQIDVVLQIKNGVHRTLWLRRIRELGMRLVDQGELLRNYAAHLASRGTTRTLGPITIPQAFDDDVCETLWAWTGTWPDALSNRTFLGYLLFLQSGLLSALADVVSAEVSEHPFFRNRNPHTDAFKACATQGLIWEIADTRSAFLEQLLVANNIGTFDYGFSSFTADKALAEGKRLSLLFSSLGIVPALSSFSADTTKIVQNQIGTAPLPKSDAANKFVRLDVEQPVALLEWLNANTDVLLAKVRIKRPADLLQCLQLFPVPQLSLRCDRPGPAGLELTISKLPIATAVGNQ